jgi:uncharacterized Tic20 family protein
MNTELPPKTPLYPPPVRDEQLTADERTWGALAHVSAFCTLIGIPSVIGPLIVWVIKKDQSSFVADQAKEAMNFHLTMLIGIVVSIPFVFCGIGIFTGLAIVLLSLVLNVVAAVKASNGELYRYPLTIRMIR